MAHIQGLKTHWLMMRCKVGAYLVGFMGPKKNFHLVLVDTHTHTQTNMNVFCKAYLLFLFHFLTPHKRSPMNNISQQIYRMYLDQPEGSPFFLFVP